MSDANNATYEKVAVLAVCMQNAERIPFEEHQEYMLEQYWKLLNDCMKMMRGNKCRDIILYNNHIYAIYDGSHNKAGRDLETTGIGINRLVRAFNGKTEKRDTEKLLCGIGIAAGIAVRVPVGGAFERNGMWMGCVFHKAYSMAQMSICDGMHRVFVDDTVDRSVYT